MLRRNELIHGTIDIRGLSNEEALQKIKQAIYKLALTIPNEEIAFIKHQVTDLNSHVRAYVMLERQINEGNR